MKSKLSFCLLTVSLLFLGALTFCSAKELDVYDSFSRTYLHDECLSPVYPGNWEVTTLYSQRYNTVYVQNKCSGYKSSVVTAAAGKTAQIKTNFTRSQLDSHVHVYDSLQ
ncbi:MAG: hypothetical protein ACLUVC_07275 [Longibaculum sp.]